MNAREAILAGVRSALAGAERSGVPTPRGYRDRPRTRTPDELVDLFVERVEDYRATVTRCTGAQVADVVARLVPEAARVVVAPELPWAVAGDRDAGFSAEELDRYDAVVTAAGLGIAETGTIVLTHTAAEGRRALSLVPDMHVCVVRADQVVADVPDAFPLLDPRRPTTWVSGPSATSDIELDRVEGVHGPRTLHVLLVD